MQVHIAHEFAVRRRGGVTPPADELREEASRLMEALRDLERVSDHVTDSTASSDADRGVIRIELLVAAADEAAALGTFIAVVRTAIHAIGGVAPGWDEPLDPVADYEPRDLRLEYL
jgi:hypothetical protein